MGLSENSTADFTEDDIPWEGGQHLFRLWTDKKGNRPFPARPEFQPVEMKAHLPGMSLIDVEQDPLRFRIRLIGTAQVEIIGSDPTGRYADEIGLYESVIKRWTWIVENRRPVVAISNPLQQHSDTYVTYSSLVMPLGHSDDAVNMLIAHVNTERIRKG